MEGLSERIPRAVLVQTFCGSWGSRCTFPLDTKQMKSQSVNPVPCFRPGWLPVHSARNSSSWISPPLPLLLPGYIVSVPTRRTTAAQTANTKELTRNGKLFTVGIVATTSRESSGLVSSLRRHRGNALRTGLAFAADWISKCDGRSPVNRWPPLLSCVGCLVECVAAAFWYFIFQRRCCNRMQPTPICFTWSAHHHG